MHAYPAWIVVADEHAVRMLRRTSPGTRLMELTEYADSADVLGHNEELASDLYRSGGRIMLKSRSRRTEEELQTFLRRVAGSIDDAIAKQRPGSLALHGPTRVLALLRDYVSPDSRALLVSETRGDLVRDPVSVIDAAMRQTGI